MVVAPQHYLYFQMWFVSTLNTKLKYHSGKTTGLISRVSGSVPGLIPWLQFTPTCPKESITFALVKRTGTLGEDTLPVVFYDQPISWPPQPTAGFKKGRIHTNSRHLGP